MRRLINKIIAIIIVSILPLLASNFENRIISTIIVTGNESTNENVIKRELLFSTGDTYSDSLRILSEKRVINLLLFNDVQIIPIPDNNNVSLLVNVTERLFLFPFPKYRIEDRDWDKLTYGFGLAHTNFGGENQKVIVTLLFGYRPGYQFDYYNPWISGTNHISAGFSILQYETRHSVLDFTQNHFILSGNAGKHWTRYFYNSFIMTYNNIRVPGDISPRMFTSSKEENLFSFALATVYDDRDLIAYPTAGWFASFTYMKLGLFEKKINYNRYLFELIKYQTFSEITLAARLHTTISEGKLPIYDRVYFGFSERVRGHFSKVIAGEHRVIGSLEARYPIILPFRINLPTPYLPENSTSSLKFGLNAAIFYDAGKVWGVDILEESGYLSSNDHGQLIQGFGFSLHFILPYIEIARLEIAFNEKLASEYIFEIGTAF